MDAKVIPSIKLDQQQRLAIALAGTVALPSPHPAYGKVFLGLHASGRDELPSSSPRFFLKSVEYVSVREVVTRIIALNDLRAVSCPDEEYAHDPKAKRVTHLIEDLVREGREIHAAKHHLEAAERNAPGDYEIELFPVAVLHVPETAPVLARLVFETGVTAAESLLVIHTYIGGCCTT